MGHQRSWCHNGAYCIQPDKPLINRMVESAVFIRPLTSREKSSCCLRKQHITSTNVIRLTEHAQRQFVGATRHAWEKTVNLDVSLHSFLIEVLYCPFLVHGMA
uniref:Uncharacterized protein n=1 Tax=Parascaris equorum TaxID=6256 RepID=A0A914RG29_PAREQ